MRRTLLPKALALGSIGLLALPTLAFAQDGIEIESLATQLTDVWIIVAACLVLFMQAGFLGLELGFSRGKSVGSGVGKIVVNLAIASVMWWIIGYGIAFGGDNGFMGTSGFFFQNGTEILGEAANNSTLTFFVFQFTFCAVSLAIVWGSTLERIKFAVYPLFAIPFAAIVYPIVAHWSWGGGWLSTFGGGVQDFAGSGVVHLTGATAALVACLLLGPRKGKYGPDGKPRAIPGHSMPIFGFGVLILWLGWFGFNGGSTLGTADSAFGHVIAVTNLGAAGGVIGALIMVRIVMKTLDIGMIGNGAIAGLVAITAPSGYVELWAAPIIGLIGGFIVVVGVVTIDKFIDDPVGATSAHGLAGIWGTLSCGIFTSPRLMLEGQHAGLVYGDGLQQLWVQFVATVATFGFVFACSLIVFGAIKYTVGMRVDEADEDAGLDISEHGMYGYPEQFIPAPELVGYSPSPGMSTAGAATTSQEVPAT